MSTNQFNIGDTVRIKNLSRDFNGCVGQIVGINGEYHYVDIYKSDENITINIEAYRCEMDKQTVFAEDLFQI